MVRSTGAPDWARSASSGGAVKVLLPRLPKLTRERASASTTATAKRQQGAEPNQRTRAETNRMKTSESPNRADEVKNTTMGASILVHR